MTLSTVYTTKVYTITSCAPTVTDCPGKIGSITTEVISLYTTYCPGNVAVTPAPVSTSSAKKVSMITTVVVTSYVDYCPGSGELTTVVLSSTMVVPKQTSPGPMTQPSIPMVTTTKTLTVSGSTIVATLTIPAGAAPPTPVVGGPVIATPAGPVTTAKSTVVVVPVPVSSPVYPAGNSTKTGVVGVASGSVTLPKTGATAAASPKASALTAGAGTKEWNVVAFIGALGAALVML
jgi:hypothetical protein